MIFPIRGIDVARVARSLMTICVVGAGLAACQTVPSNLPPAPRATSVATAPYLLQPGDVVELHSPLAPDLDEQVAVGPDGGLVFHYTDQIAASGHTLKDISDIVREK